MNQALAQFLDDLEAKPSVAIGLVRTIPGASTVASIAERYAGRAYLDVQSHRLTTPTDLADEIAAGAARMRVQRLDTMIIDLSDLNSGWLQASPFDYMLRSIAGGMAPDNLSIERIILVSKQRGFKLSPATMQHIRTIDVEVA